MADSNLYGVISIHVPHTRDDSARPRHALSYREFQSTSLTRGTTFRRVVFLCRFRFQSTSLTRGTTSLLMGSKRRLHNFNPRPSHEGRRPSRSTSSQVNDFNPRPSHEGRRTRNLLWCGPKDFNPRPSHEGRLNNISFSSSSKDFNPRPSHEGRLLQDIELSGFDPFQSTSLTRGTTPAGGNQHRRGYISIHVPHTRDDVTNSLISRSSLISIHVPHTRDDCKTNKFNGTIFMKA